MLRACLDLTERLQGIGELERNLNDGRCIESWTKFSWVMGQVARPLLGQVKGSSTLTSQKKADGSDCFGNLKNKYLFRDVWGVRLRNKVSNVGL